MCWPCLSYSVGLLLPVSGFLEYAFIFQQLAVIVLWFAGWRENERCCFQSGQIPRSWGRIFYPLRREGKLLSGRYLMLKNVYVSFWNLCSNVYPELKRWKLLCIDENWNLNWFFFKLHYFQRSSIKMLKKLLISQCKRKLKQTFPDQSLFLHLQ